MDFFEKFEHEKKLSRWFGTFIDHTIDKNWATVSMKLFDYTGTSTTLTGTSTTTLT